jgi:hypothetical protein
MRTSLLLALGLFGAAVLPLGAQAAQAQKKPMTPEQQQVWKEMLDKYDLNKDGSLDRAERAKVTQQDKEKMEKVGLLGSQKKKTSPAK